VKVEFDPEADAAYIYLLPIGAGEAVEQVPVTDLDERVELILDFNREGRLIGIELPGGAARLLPREVLDAAERP
jgi:uncharacterized protein YuzE